MSRICLREAKIKEDPKQRSGKGGDRGSDIRREATAEQNGYRPCRFTAHYPAHHISQRTTQPTIQLLKRRRNSCQPRRIDTRPHSWTFEAVLQSLRTDGRTVHR